MFDEHMFSFSVRNIEISYKGTKSDKQSISIDADTHKNLTITISAKDLKKKNVNLRNSVVTITNPVYYYSYK